MRWGAAVLIFAMVLAFGSCHFQTKLLLKFYEECSQTDWQSCLKIKLLANLEKFRGMEVIPVVEGLSLVNENFLDESSQPLDPFFSEKVLMESLPRTIEARNDLLNSLIAEKVSSFISKFTVRCKLSSLRAAASQARGKSKKYSQLLMLPLMMAASFIPVALGALLLLAGKALIIGKMALLLVAILGMRKLFSNGHDQDDHQRAMKRISDIGMRLKSEMMAHRMAYRAPAELPMDM